LTVILTKYIHNNTLRDRIINQEIRRIYGESGINTLTEWKTIELLKLRETENHTLEDRHADHQRGGGIPGCRRRKEPLKLEKQTESLFQEEEEDVQFG